MKKFLFIATFFTAVLGYAQTTMNVNSFSKIKIDTDAQVEIVYSTKDQVLFNQPENQLEHIQVTSDNNTLTITGKAVPGLRVRIYTNSLKAIAAHGNSTITLSKYDYLNTLFLSIKEGSSVNTGDTKIKSLTVLRDGSSQAIYANVKEVKETVDGILLASRE